MKRLKHREQSLAPVKKERTKGRKWFSILVAIFCFLLLVSGGAAYYIYQGLQPTATGSQTEKLVNIPTGTSVREIGALLEKEGLIRNGSLFAYYVQYKGMGNRMQAGEYKIQTGQSVDQLIETLAEGAAVDTVRFTIPEGWNVDQIATSLEKKGLVKKEQFLKEVNQGQFPEFPFLSAIPKKEGRKYRLEGYLFPETYEVKKDANEHEIIAKMLAQFEKEMQPEWLEALKKRNMTVDDAVNLASIVEREVVVDKERPVVAGVFFNRIRDKWLLQSCATVQFVLGKQRDRITFDDLKIKSAYNTYLNPGLPPGPIASPGRASLAAVVAPAKHDYFFFVTKKDGTSEHFFSKTLEEHLAKDAKSKGNW